VPRSFSDFEVSFGLYSSNKFVRWIDADWVEIEL
jgi:hypothetical protein